MPVERRVRWERQVLKDQQGRRVQLEQQVLQALKDRPERRVQRERRVPKVQREQQAPLGRKVQWAQ